MTGAYDTAAAEAALAVARAYTPPIVPPNPEGAARKRTAETISIRNCDGVMVADNVDPRYAAHLRIAVEAMDRGIDLAASWS